MTATQQLKINCTPKEKTTLYDAADLFEEIYKALDDNKANGHTPFQEGLNAPEAFWKIYHYCLQIQDKELIP